MKFLPRILQRSIPATRLIDTDSAYAMEWLGGEALVVFPPVSIEYFGNVSEKAGEEVSLDWSPL